MKHLILLILFFILPVMAQENDSSGFNFEFQTGLIKFSMDGKFDNGDFAWGTVYQTDQAVIEPGLFITSNIDINSKEKEEVIHLGTLLTIQVKRALSVGLYYDFWKSGVGLDGWRRDNTGLMFAYNFEL